MVSREQKELCCTIFGSICFIIFSVWEIVDLVNQQEAASDDTVNSTTPQPSPAVTTTTTTTATTETTRVSSLLDEDVEAAQSRSVTSWILALCACILVLLLVCVFIFYRRRRRRKSTPYQWHYDKPEAQEEEELYVFVDGMYSGYKTYDKHGERIALPAFSLQFDDESGTVSGRGSDDSGPFSIRGEFSTAERSLQLDKVYTFQTTKSTLKWSRQRNQFEGEFYIEYNVRTPVRTKGKWEISLLSQCDDEAERAEHVVAVDDANEEHKETCPDVENGQTTKAEDAEFNVRAWFDENLFFATTYRNAYRWKFEQNGYDNVDAICGLTREDLKRIGITSAAHQTQILKAINNSLIT